MKNARKTTRITREDLDSFLLWKAFWKLIRQETLLGFTWKVFLIGVFSFVLVIFHMGLRSWLGE